MKSVIFAASIAALGSMAYADGIDTVGQVDGVAFVGNLEYAVEASTFEAVAGVKYGLVDRVTIGAFVKGDDIATDDFDLTGVDLSVSFAATENVSMYAVGEFDNDLSYSEARVGVAFSF